MPLIRRLLIEEAEDAGAIVVVADADARLLWVEGDAHLRRQAEGMNWVAGSRWDERTAGTNAPAAAMRLDHALQVFAREHFASNVAAWSCTAAPIHDPLTGEVLGALDITGRDDVAAPAVLGLVRAAAAAAETELRMRALTQRRRQAGPQTPPGRIEILRARLLRRPAPSCCPCWAGTGRCSARQIDRSTGTELSIRHSELLFLLARHRAGYTRRPAGDRPARAGRPGGHRARRAEPVARHWCPTWACPGGPTGSRRPCPPTWRGPQVPAAAGTSPARWTPTPGRSCRPRSHRRCRPNGTCCTARSVPPCCVRPIRGGAARSRTAPAAATDTLVWRHAVAAGPAVDRPVLVEHLLRIEREMGGVPVRAR